MLSRTRLRSVLSVFGIVSTVILLGAGCNGCNHEEMVPPKKEVPVYTQKQVTDPVVWPASSTINQAALAAMKPEERAKVALSGVPVLVPNDPKFLATGILIEPNEFRYGFGSPEPIDGVDFTISASRVSVQSNAPVPVYASDPSRQQGDRIMVGDRKVSINRITGDGGNDEGPWVIGWMEYGKAGYSVILSCAEDADPRCADDTYIKSFVASLVYVGGSGK